MLVYVISKSREKALITKEHIAMHTQLNFFKSKAALYTSMLVITLFNSSTKLF